MIDRRAFLAGTAALAGCAATRQGDARDPNVDALHRLCAGMGAGNRLGVMILDTGSGRRAAYRADETFAMASTFKLALAGFVLAEAEAGRLNLTEELPFTRSDMLSHAPVTEANLAAGRLSIERLCQAIVEVSDNPAANLLLRRTGGPAAFTAFLRTLGDNVTRLDRWETALNENAPGDVRDTTSPAAMVGTMQALLLGNRLTAAGRARLTGWMETSTTGLDRLRAGFPAGWRVGDKTGTGGRGAHNDIAIAWPPDEGRAPILIAAYLDAPGVTEARRPEIHAEIGRIAARMAQPG